MFGLLRPGVAVRDTGDFDRSDTADERFVEVRRSAGSIAAASGCAAGSPFASAGPYYGQSRVHIEGAYGVSLTFFRGPWLAVLTRFLLLIISVFKLIGRGLPCSLRNKPQALQSTEPCSSRRHSGVVLVEQFWHTGCRG